MKLVWRTHRVTLLLLGTSGAAAIALAAPQWMLALPSLSGAAGVPLRVVLALAACILIGYSITSAWPARRVVGVRRPAALTVAVVAFAVLPPVLIGVVAAVFATPHALAFASVFLWLLALQLVVACVVSATYQALAPAAYVLVCALIGRANGEVRAWAWPLVLDVPVAALFASLAALAVALLLVLVRGLRAKA